MTNESYKELEVNQTINWPVVIVIIIGTFMVFLDSSIVNIALPKLMAVFGTSPETIDWVLTAYMLTLGVAMPLTGFLGDTFGYKRCYFLALGLFIIGSGLCGLAWNFDSMIVARIIQAIGGGILEPIGMAIIYNNCPKDKVGMVLGLWGVAAAGAPAVGPTLGGYLIQYTSWHLIFYMNIPVGIINLFLVGIFLQETDLIKGKHFDLWGVILSCIGFFCLLLALSKGADRGWTSFYIISLLITAGVSLTIFVINELRHPEPILNLRLFKNPIFTISNMVSSLLAIGMFGALFLMPILLQDVLGQNALQAGLLLLPGGLSCALTMPISGLIFDRYGARRIGILGLAIIAIATYLLSTINDHTSFTVISIIFMARGIGLGLSIMPVLTAGANTVPAHLSGSASAIINVIRQVFASFGIAIFDTIMVNRQVFHFANLVESVTPRSVSAMQNSLQGMVERIGTQNFSLSTPTGALPSSGMAKELGASLIGLRIQELSMIRAIDDCYLVATAITLLGLVLVMFLNDRKKLS